MSRKKAYVIGTNVSNSLSPAIFRYWFEKHNVCGEYGYIEIKEKEFDKEIKQILKDENLVGLNITMPYKEKIIPHLMNPVPPVMSKDEGPVLSQYAERIGAVNWISRENKVWLGDNSDWFGFEKSFEVFFNATTKERKNIAIVIGYGGASKAIIFSLHSLGYKKIKLFNRSYEKIKNKFAKTSSSPLVETYELGDLEKHTHSADAIINTTPVNILNKPKEWNISSNTIGFDVVYRPKGGSGFLNYFEPNRRLDGIHMLINQAIPCLENWFAGNKTYPADTLCASDDLINLLYKKMDENT